MLSWLELVKKLGIFTIIRRFEIVFTFSVNRLIPFFVYFTLMMFTFLTTHAILQKNDYRKGKIGEGGGNYSEETYRKYDAIKINESVLDQYKSSINHIWTAMVQGDYDLL